MINMQDLENTNEQKENSAHTCHPKTATFSCGAFQPSFYQYVLVESQQIVVLVGQKWLNISSCIWFTLIIHLDTSIYYFLQMGLYYT